ncbi:MAG: hypothetical protein P4L92_03455 [Rudaea sp.]|nr:hypothetical protein [Rudaea sp.]
MNRHEDLLQQIARIARASHDFFVDVYPGVTDAEVRTAFAYISEIKSRLVADLEPWLAPTAANGGMGDHISPASVVEKMYADVRRNFRGNQPAASAAALGFGEEQLLRLTERAFSDASVSSLRELLKSYYPQLVICREAMFRLRARQAA